MTSYLAILKRVGIALTIVGMLDIVIMIVRIANHTSYSSSFNIFAVVAGIYLIKGSIRASRVVHWISAFMLVAFIGILVLTFLLQPLQLTVTGFKLNPYGYLASYSINLLVIAFLIWIFTQLARPEVMAARKEAGFRTGRPIYAYVISSITLLVFSGMMLLANHGDTVNIAKRLASKELGAGYSYYINSIRWSTAGNVANVIAYNEHEIKSVMVSWGTTEKTR